MAILHATNHTHNTLAKIKKMNRTLITVIYFILHSGLCLSQVEINPNLSREINEQVFKSDISLPATAILMNKKYGQFNGSVAKEIIHFTDSTKLINKYNKSNSLVSSQFFKNHLPSSEYKFEYLEDGITLKKESGINTLDFLVLKNDEYVREYYGLQGKTEKQGIFYKYLDTLFVKETKYSYEYEKQSNSIYNPIEVYRYKYKYNNKKYLKSIEIFENDIKVGHLTNIINSKGQVESQELFWEYKWFVEDTGFPSIRNKYTEISYSEKGLISEVIIESYNPVSREWKKEVINYKSNLSIKNNIIQVIFLGDNGETITIKIDETNNWIYKAVKNSKNSEVTTRLLEYYKK